MSSNVTWRFRVVCNKQGKVFDHHMITIFVYELTAIVQIVSSGFYPIMTTRQAWLLWGKNLFLNSTIGAWFNMAIVALAQSETKDPIGLSHPSMDTLFSFIQSCKNWWPLMWSRLKVVIHCLAWFLPHGIWWCELRWGAFSVAIDFGMKMPSGFSGEVPKFYFVAAVAVEKRCAMAMDSPWPERCEGSRAFFCREKGVRGDNDAVNIKP